MKNLHSPENRYVAVGFDGFVDTLVKPVRSIHQSTKQHFGTIDEFGRYLSGKAGYSCSIDLDKHSERPGGNSALFAIALAALGVQSSCVGAYGYPQLHPAFVQQQSKACFRGVLNPGSCTALEFEDGKVMLSYNGDLDNMTFETITSCTGEEWLTQWLRQSCATAILNWSEIPGSSGIWRQVQRIAKQNGFTPSRWLMLDISDCSRRSQQDLHEMKQLMGNFSNFYRVVFSLNTNETKVLCTAFGHPFQDIQSAARFLLQVLKVELLVVHTLDGAVYTGLSDEGKVFGFQIQQPAIATGGGDNFNAGLLFGLLQGWKIHRCVQTASTVSMLYVKNGNSPNWNQVETHLKKLP